MAAGRAAFFRGDRPEPGPVRLTEKHNTNRPVTVVTQSQAKILFESEEARWNFFQEGALLYMPADGTYGRFVEINNLYVQDDPAT